MRRRRATPRRSQTAAGVRRSGWRDRRAASWRRGAHRARAAAFRRSPSGDQAAQLVGKVGLFPGEAAIGIWLAAKMAIGGSARIDRLVEAEMLAGGPPRKGYH